MASNLQAANFIALTFITQNNGVREKNRTQGIRRPYMVPQGGPSPTGAPPEIPRGVPMHPTTPHHESGREVEKHHPQHDLEDPQDRYRLLRTKTKIQSQGRLRLIPPRRWFHGPPLFSSRQQHHQADWTLVQQQDAQVPPCAGRATHEEFLLAHAHA